MSNIERWERLAVLSWDRHGMPQTVRALTPGGMALRDGETEYVRADLHRGAVEARRALREARSRLHDYALSRGSTEGLAGVFEKLNAAYDTLGGQ